MKKILFLCFLLVICPIYPQISINNYQETNNKIEFDLSLSSIPHRSIVKGTDIRVNFNDFQDESHPGSYSLPTRDFIVALPSYSKVEVSTSPLSVNKIKGKPNINPQVSSNNNESLTYKESTLMAANLQKNIVEIKRYIWFRNYYCVHLKVNQYSSNSDIINEIQKLKITLKIITPEKIKRLNIKEGTEEKEFLTSSIVNYKNASPLDRNYFEPLANNYSWIDFSKTYLKLGTNADGIYRITKADLDNNGINTSVIIPSTFKIYLRGIEVPTIITDSLGVIKYIEFFGLRNWGDKDYREVSGPNEPYKEYLNRYSDTTIYWLTWDGEAGIQTPIQQGNIGIPTDTINYYADVFHVEKNQYLDYSMEDIIARQLPMWKQNQTWVWGQQRGGDVYNLGFTATDIYPGKSAHAYYKVQDFASDITLNAHLIGLNINSDTTTYNSGYFNKYEQKVVTAEFISNILLEGDNTLKATSYQTQAKIVNSIEYDWYEVEYPRYLKAINDSLRFTINDVTGNAVRAFRITNLSNSNMLLYKYNPGIKKIVNYIRNNDQLYFNDTVQAGDKYCLISESSASTPYYFYTKKFTDLSSSSLAADYILITHPVLLPKANEYAAFISQNYGLATKVINVFDIYDQFYYGFFAPEPIKDFLITAHNNWQAPKPMYLFLVGDANYDYYGNKAIYFNNPKVMNFVPSFGEPVSDSWYTMWDSTLIPQMYIGRLPATSVEEFQHFFDKHKAYLNTPFDDWNKYYLLFSSGNSDDPNELSYLKQANDQVISNYIQPAPIGGIAQHLYKTYDPRTNFGPYTQDQINTMIGNGGVFISYVGHSGTQIWDNGISDVAQLKNNRGRSSMISDFGCSTGKFAEPDIKAFSELFVNGLDGDAIGYEGNASLGFTSTATSFPLLFYKKILKDSILTLGKAHVLAKIDLLNTYGSNLVNQVFMYSNTLFTDPVINLRVPAKPNLNISAKNISLDKNSLDESTDSVSVKINYNNYGLVSSKTFTIAVVHSINNIVKDTISFIRPLPLLTDSVVFKLPVKGFVGSHRLDIVLDKYNEIDEIYKTDNNTSYTFNVASNSIRVLSTEPVNNIGNGIFIFINPVNKSGLDSLQYEVANNPGFNPSRIYYKKLDTAYTKVIVPSLIQKTRYWFRSKFNETDGYGTTISFIYDSTSGFSYYIGDSVSISSLNLNGIKYDGTQLLLDKTYKDLVVKSAGFYDGGFAYIGINGNDLLASGNLDGVHVVVFSDSNLTFESTQLFNSYLNDTLFDRNFTDFLDKVSVTKTVCFAFCGGGSILTDSMKTLLHNFGSKFIDSIGVRYSWALIGKKGSIPGTVPEKWSKPFGGFVTLDSTYVSDLKSAKLVTGKFGPVNMWNKFTSNYTVDNTSSITFTPVGIRQDGTIDTLSTLNIQNGTADLSFINASVYRNIQIIVNFNKGGTSIPSIKDLKVEYESFPEIGTNYQAVQILKDTVTIGENLNLNFRVFNEGFTKVDSFKVRLERVKPDNSRDFVNENSIDNFLPGEERSFNVIYPTTGGSGAGTFVINIDPDNSVTEFYKDNNLYAVPFYIKGDTTHPSLSITIDGGDIIDGDYISSTPNIKMELNDQSLLPITDPASIMVTLNDTLISNVNNPFVNVTYSASNPKMIVEYKPHLADGEYTLNVKGRNAHGVLTDSSGITRRFQVSSDAKILDVYNYPNPFSKDTYFTFKLTQIPDELKIKIFTVAGRLVREIDKKSFELNYDFNRIHWDGRDEDGDALANGVYFYKMLMTKGSKTENVVQKLAIIK